MTQTGQAEGWIGIKIETALVILAGIALGAFVFDTLRYLVWRWPPTPVVMKQYRSQLDERCPQALFAPWLSATDSKPACKGQ
jgi:hypothetical protein